MELPRGLARMGAVDALVIVPVRDAYGGVTIYSQDCPTHYLLAGEWYTALAEPIGPGEPPCLLRRCTLRYRTAERIRCPEMMGPVDGAPVLEYD